MKNQYVGDVNDYFKYAFLRTIQRHVDAPLVLCWMATADDGSSDGGRRTYLSQPQKYRSVDPALFDQLQRLVEESEPTMAAVERAGLVPRARFVRPVLPDAIAGRASYFDNLWTTSPAGSIIFFDPDNGLEVKSTPKGRKHSSKFLYLDEVQRAGTDGRCAVVYQQFGRVERASYTIAQLHRMRERLPSHRHFALSSSHVAFLVAAAPENCRSLRNAAMALRGRWQRLRLHDPEDAEPA